ncbi:transporter substrate-binding domain-containing protein [Kiritimatiellaeota bacterium B1221]|nr:transporter substrate-binding domain-containing protein [Kiritimatiellaeota bacterium B1221]
MKKIYFLLLTLCGLWTVSAEEWLVMGFDDWPPFTGKGGSPRVAVEMLTMALERLDYHVDRIPLPHGEFSRVFTDDQIQLSPALWHDPSREEVMIFTNPIFENRLILVGRPGSDAASMGLSTLDGKKLAVVEGYAYGEKLATCPAEVVLGKSDAANIRSLMNGDVDYVLISELLMIYAKRAQKHGFTDMMEVGTIPQITRDIHFAVKRSTPNAKKIVAELNSEIEKMMVDGSYYEILGINRIIKDIDGDGKPEVLLLGDPAQTLNPEEVYYTGGNMDIPEAEMDHWFMVDGKFYKTIEEVPEDKREKMNTLADKQVKFLIEE